jgi:hypothetical protein
MRNRGVEIFILTQEENLGSGKLDCRSLLYHSGLEKRNHQEALMMIHKRMSEDSSNVDGLNIVHLLHSAFLVVQQLSRGFPLSPAFKSSCTDVYLRARLIFHRETKTRLSAIIEDAIREFKVDEGQDYALNLDAATCSLRNLLDNSKLALLRQQGLLLDWCANAYEGLAKRKGEASNGVNNGASISFNTGFLNDFFAPHEDETLISNVQVLDVLPYILLNFYEHSSLDDVKLRGSWASNIFKRNPNFEILDKKNSVLLEQVLSFNFEGCDTTLPWDRKQFKYANNLALLLYYASLVDNNDIKDEWKIDNCDQIITVAQFSRAHLEGKK